MNSPSLQPRKPSRRKRHFLAAWMRSPKDMGAIVPSSKRLARAMATQVDQSVPGVVVELGGGTGVVTQALLAAGIAPERLLVIERDPRLHEMLSAHFPNVCVLCEDAVHLEAILRAQGHTQVCAVVSSLPFLSLPKLVGQAIQAQMMAAIGTGGRIVQFTYGMQSPINRQQAEAGGLSSQRSRIVVANVPPAHVWVYRRQRPV